MIEHPAIPRPRRVRAAHQPSSTPARARPPVLARRDRTRWWHLLREAALLGLLLALYRVGRTLADGRHPLARENAFRLRGVEARLHLPDEVHVQHLLLAHPHLAQAADTYYAGVHFPLTGAVLLWLFLRSRSTSPRDPHPGGLYRRTRDALVLATAVGLLLAFAYPLAPPRMMTGLGFTDVAALFGQSVYQGGAAGSSNQFAAMPSLHVGWAVLVALALSRAAPATGTRGRRLRWLWWAHPVITVLVVIGTGNHYWLDVVVGTALVSSAWAVTRPRSRSRALAPRPSTGALGVRRRGGGVLELEGQFVGVAPEPLLARFERPDDGVPDGGVVPRGVLPG